MDWFFKYMWLIFGIYNSLGFFTIPARVKKMAKNSDDELVIRKFMVTAMVYWTAPYFVTGFIQLLGGFSSPFYIFFGPLDNLFVVAAILMWILFLAGIAYWAFLKDGARTLIQYQLVQGIGANNESAIKIFLGIALLGAMLAVTLMRFVLPPFPDSFFPR